MEFWMIIMQIAHTETLPIDKNVFIGLPEEGIATRKKTILQVSSADFTYFQ